MNPLLSFALGLMLSAQASAQWIERARLSHVDLDGDGTDEVVVGGRVGPFLPEDAPADLRRARIEILRGSGGWMTPLARSEDLHVVDDVEAGDFDGDGRVDILAVGGDRLFLLRPDRDRLTVVAETALPGSSRRVSASRGSPEGIVAATSYDVDTDGDAGTTTVILLGLRGDTITRRGEIAVRGHVGDLAFVRGEHERLLLVAETGGGDEGGDARVWDAIEFGRPRRVWEGRVTSGARALTVAADPTGEVVFGGMDGTVTTCAWSGEALTVLGRSHVGVVEDFTAVAPGRWAAWLREGRGVHLLDVPR